MSRYTKQCGDAVLHAELPLHLLPAVTVKHLQGESKSTLSSAGLAVTLLMNHSWRSCAVHRTVHSPMQQLQLGRLTVLQRHSHSPNNLAVAAAMAPAAMAAATAIREVMAAAAAALFAAWWASWPTSEGARSGRRAEKSAA